MPQNIRILLILFLAALLYWRLAGLHVESEGNDSGVVKVVSSSKTSQNPNQND